MISKAYIVSLVTLLITQNNILAAPSSYDVNSVTNRKVLDKSDILPSNNDVISPFIQNKETKSNSNLINGSEISNFLRGTSKPGFGVDDVLGQTSSTSSGDKLSYKRPNNYQEKNTSTTLGSSSTGISGKKNSLKSPGISSKGTGSNTDYKQKSSSGTESPENEIIIDRYQEHSEYKGKPSSKKQSKGKVSSKHGVSKKKPVKSIGKTTEVGYKFPSNKKNNSNNPQTTKSPHGDGNGFSGNTKPKITKPSKVTKPVLYEKRPTLNNRRPRPSITRPTIRPGLNYKRPGNNNYIRHNYDQRFNGNNAILYYARPGQIIDYARSNPNLGQISNPYHHSQNDNSYYTYRRP